MTEFNYIFKKVRKVIQGTSLAFAWPCCEDLRQLGQKSLFRLILAGRLVPVGEVEL